MYPRALDPRARSTDPLVHAHPRSALRLHLSACLPGALHL